VGLIERVGDYGIKVQNTSKNRRKYRSKRTNQIPKDKHKTFSGKCHKEHKTNFVTIYHQPKNKTQCLKIRIWNLLFGIWILEFPSLGFGIWDLGFGIWDLGFGIWDLEFGIWNLEFGIWNLM
jgi:hypothetical protein